MFWVLEDRRGGSSNPYAVRSKLVWAVVGRKYPDSSVTDVGVNFVNTVAAKQPLDRQIECLWTSDNVPNCDIPLSKEDRYALQVMKEAKRLKMVITRLHFRGGLAGLRCKAIGSKLFIA